MGIIIALLIVFTLLILDWAADRINNTTIRILVMIVVAVLDCVGIITLIYWRFQYGSF